MSLDTVEIDGVRLKLASPMDNRASGLANAKCSNNCWPAGWSSTNKTCRLTPRLGGRAWHWQNGVGHGRSGHAQTGTVRLSMHGRYATGRFVGYAGAEPTGNDFLSRVAAGDRHAARCGVRAGRRESHERKVVGQLGSAVRSATLRRVDRGGYRDSRPQRFSRGGDDESRRFDLRNPRLYPQSLAAHAAARLSQSPGRIGDPAVSLAVCRSGHVGDDGRVSAALARFAARFFSSRWLEFVALCAQATCRKIPSIHSAKMPPGTKRSNAAWARMPSIWKRWPSARVARSGGNMLPLGLGDFFFDPDDPLHPDFDGDDDDSED